MLEFDLRWYGGGDKTAGRMLRRALLYDWSVGAQFTVTLVDVCYDQNAIISKESSKANDKMAKKIY